MFEFYYCSAVNCPTFIKYLSGCAWRISAKHRANPSLRGSSTIRKGVKYEDNFRVKQEALVILSQTVVTWAVCDKIAEERFPTAKGSRWTRIKLEKDHIYNKTCYVSGVESKLVEYSELEYTRLSNVSSHRSSWSRGLQADLVRHSGTAWSWGSRRRLGSTWRPWSPWARRGKLSAAAATRQTSLDGNLAMKKWTMS